MRRSSLRTWLLLSLGPLRRARRRRHRADHVRHRLRRHAGRRVRHDASVSLRPPRRSCRRGRRSAAERDGRGAGLERRASSRRSPRRIWRGSCPRSLEPCEHRRRRVRALRRRTSSRSGARDPTALIDGAARRRDAGARRRRSDPHASVGRRRPALAVWSTAARLGDHRGARAGRAAGRRARRARRHLRPRHRGARHRRRSDVPMAILAVSAMLIMVVLMQTSMVWVLEPRRRPAQGGRLDRRRAARRAPAGRRATTRSASSPARSTASSSGCSAAPRRRRASSPTRATSSRRRSPASAATRASCARGAPRTRRCATRRSTRSTASRAAWRGSPATCSTCSTPTRASCSRRERFDLNVRRARAARRRRRAARSTRTSSSSVPRRSRCSMVGDPDRVEDVISILLDNAGKYTPAGGQRRRARPRQARDTVIVRSRDTGQGIPEDDLPRIFDRFFRSEASRAAGEGGFGLGLAIAKNIVDSMGGEIDGRAASWARARRSPSDPPRSRLAGGPSTASARRRDSSHRPRTADNIPRRCLVAPRGRLACPLDSATSPLRAFSSPEWRGRRRAVRGDRRDRQRAWTSRSATRSPRTSAARYCNLATDVDVAHAPCVLRRLPDARRRRLERVVCRAGCRTLIAPVDARRRSVAHLVLGGFVTSTRERRRLYEKLLAAARQRRRRPPDASRRSPLCRARPGRGLPADGARQRARHARRRRPSDAASCRARRGAAALRLGGSAGRRDRTPRRGLARRDRRGGRRARRRRGRCGAAAGRATCSRSSRTTESWRGPVGALVPTEGTAAGRAIDTGRTVVVERRRHRVDDRDAGAAAHASATGCSACSRSGCRTTRCRSRRSASRGSTGSATSSRSRWSATTSARRSSARWPATHSSTSSPPTLGGQTDIDGVARIVTSVLDKAFTFEIAGLVLTGYGRDHADVVVVRRGHAAASSTRARRRRRPRRRPRARSTTMRTVTHRGSIVDGEPVREDWATVGRRALARRPRARLPVRGARRRRPLQRAGPRAARGHRRARRCRLRPRRAVRPHPRRLRQDHRGALGDARRGRAHAERAFHARHGLRDAHRRGAGAAATRTSSSCASRGCCTTSARPGVPGGDPAQAVASSSAEELRHGPAARRDRRVDRRPDRVPQVAHARHPAPPRALGRRGLSGRAVGRGHPAARAHPRASPTRSTR